MTFGGKTLDEVLTQLQRWMGRCSSRDVAFSAANFSANAGIWTVTNSQRYIFLYALVQNMMTVQLFLKSTATDANIGATLFVLIPGGYLALGGIYGQVGVIRWNTGVESDMGYITTNPGGNRQFLGLNRRTDVNWPASRSDLTLSASITFGVYKP